MGPFRMYSSSIGEWRREVNKLFRWVVAYGQIVSCRSLVSTPTRLRALGFLI